MLLHKLQKQFIEDLFNLRDQPDILSCIDTSGSRSAYDQFLSYRHSVVGGMIEAMQESYPVINKLLGDECFNGLTHEFIRNFPSLSPDLNEYGKQFSSFIENTPLLDSLPYLADVAKLEWVWQLLINGMNHSQGNISLLSSVNENKTENIVFNLAPHTSLLHSNYPIHKIWQSNQANNNSNEEINLNDGEVYLIVWRLELDMHIDLLTKHEFFLLSLIKKKKYFSDICVDYLTEFSATDIGETLSACIQAAWIHSFDVD